MCDQLDSAETTNHAMGVALIWFFSSSEGLRGSFAPARVQMKAMQSGFYETFSSDERQGSPTPTGVLSFIGFRDCQTIIMYVMTCNMSSGLALDSSSAKRLPEQHSINAHQCTNHLRASRSCLICLICARIDKDMGV